MPAAAAHPQRSAYGIALLWLLISAAANATTIIPGGSWPDADLYTRPSLTGAELAVVINTADKLSVAIGDYYVRKRRIPAANVIRVRFDADRDEMPDQEFVKLRGDVEARAGRQIQAYALTWARPYRVGCMSITSAFAFGLNPAYCSQGCAATRFNPYFDASTSRPHDDLHIRPTMSVAALDFQNAKALIDRGVQADGTVPHGTAYLVATDDAARNVRAREYRDVLTPLKADLRIEVRGAPVTGRQDVVFYFTGAAAVPGLDSNRFVPGAIADHLTSFGGMLTDSQQMSSLRWLEAGAAGSYGTVVEPCNILGKFPNVAVVMTHYLAGETLIEAYWKSVEMPGQGIFIGEPLAAPFRRK
jgi:uncharacterized protein (TIGR03790 family)